MAQTDSRKISIAVLTNNKFEQVLDTFEKVLEDDRVAEIVILDDKSDEEIYWDWEDWLEFDAPQKVKLSQNQHSIGEEECKRALIVLADSDWVLYVPADQIITKTYLDKIYQHEWDKDILDIDGGATLINRNSYLKAAII